MKWHEEYMGSDLLQHVCIFETFQWKYVKGKKYYKHFLKWLCVLGKPMISYLNNI